MDNATMETVRAPAPEERALDAFASPAVDPEKARNSELHRVMLRVAFPPRGKRFREWRPAGLDRFHRMKMGFLLRQRHFVPRLLNYAIYRLERYRVANVHYFPPVVQVEANLACNLRCPGCVTGLKLPAGARQRKSTLGDLMALIDEIHTRSFQLCFHRQGEPLLSEAFFLAATYAAGKGLWTVAHSNLSLGSPELAEKIVASKLCNLVVSCDGATQETYAKYRRRGDVDLVFDNIRRIRDAKRRAGASFPWVTAKFIVFDHNWHEMEVYRQRALEAGADDVLFVTGFTDSIYSSGRAASEQEFDLRELRWVKRRIPPLCQEIWDTMGVDQDGGIQACCYAWRDDHRFLPAEEARESSVLARWNSPSYRLMRSFFAAGTRVDLASLPSPCNTCEYSRRKRAHAGDGA
jgi:MoaA/NifB/PqqE/SkfB family radical SAM enzyme